MNYNVEFKTYNKNAIKKSKKIKKKIKKNLIILNR